MTGIELEGASPNHPNLHEVSPREQSGSQTGARFEFQYHQAAADALQVLDDTKVACVYCEWHDDYVVELANRDCLQFHQVKTRSNSQSPWSVNELFGVTSPRGKAAAAASAGTAARTDSIFARFYDHTQKFGERCDAFVFVTDHGISSEFTALLGAVSIVASASELIGPPAKSFARVHASLTQSFVTVTAAWLLAFMKRLVIQPAVGSLSSVDECQLIIGGRIVDNSEVELSVPEARKIGAALVAEVRARSHLVLNSLPTSIDSLRSLKGLMLGDVLRVLSLSSAGYRELRTGGRESVLALSRLHRFLKRSGADPALIEDICQLKTLWDSWWINQRHVIEPIEYVSLKQECADVLKAHSLGAMTFLGLRSEATRLTAKYRLVLTSTDPITESHVFGLMMSLAAEAGQ
jgi:Cap4 dsDNA endonuclease